MVTSNAVHPSRTDGLPEASKNQVWSAQHSQSKGGGYRFTPAGLRLRLQAQRVACAMLRSRASQLYQWSGPVQSRNIAPHAALHGSPSDALRSIWDVIDVWRRSTARPGTRQSSTSDYLCFKRESCGFPTIVGVASSGRIAVVAGTKRCRC
jgi:hypothetical protein